MAGMNPIMGGCSKGHTWWYDGDGNICIDIQNCATCEKLTLKQLCGAAIDGVELPIIDGIIQIPPAEEDKFGTVIDNGDGTGTVTDALGNACIVVKGPITQATVADNGDGTATVTDSLGNSCIVVKGPLPPAVLSNIVDNGDGTATITQSDGTTKDVLCAGNDSIVDNGDGTSTITMPGGDVKVDAVCGVQSTVVDNGDGSATMTQNDGSTCDVVKAPLPPAAASTVVDNGDGSATITQTDGTTKDVVCAPLPPAAASNIADNGDGTATVTQTDGTTKDVLCAGTVSTVADNGDGSATITQNDGTTKDVVCAPLPAAVASSIVDNGDGSATITQTDGSTKDVVCAPLPPAAAGSDTVNNNDGTHTITTADGVSTVVCLDPVKTINGVSPDAAGNVDIADLFSTTVDNGDGTFTTTNADGTPVTWSGDTFASGASNGDGTATMTFADGSSLTLCEAPCPDLVDNGDGTATLTVGGVTIDICLDPVKDVVSADGTSLVVDGVATIPSSPGETPTQLVDNADNTFTYTNEQGIPVTVDTGSVVDNGDGTSTVTDSEGNAVIVCQNPVKDVVDSEGNSVVVDGVATLPEIDQATVADNADLTASVTDAAGNACDVATTRLVNEDTCKHEVVDTKTGTTVSDYIPFQAYIDNGFMVERVWEGSADDPCIPATPTCPDVPQKTCSPFGQEFTWASGGPWVLKEQTPNALNEKGTALNPPVLDDAGIAALGTGAWTTIATNCTTITNPNPCRDMAIMAVGRWGNNAFRMGNNITGTGNSWSVRYRSPGGMLTPVVQFDTTSLLNDVNDPQQVTEISFPPAVGVDTRTLGPGESREYCVDYDVFITEYESNPLNRITQGALEIEIIGVCV